MKFMTKTLVGLTAAGAAYALYKGGKNAKAEDALKNTEIQGFVSSGYEAVRDAFAENFSRRHELGAACCVFHKGEKVVDLWGGIRNKATGEPWEENTMVVVYSTTKGLAAMTMAVANSRGWLDYDERVSTYWPEFAQQGKESVTIRQLLAHQAGLFAIDEPVDRNTVADLDRLAVILARQKPAWEPGTRQAYHAISLGFYEGELLRRIDPQHRSLGQFFQDEIAPLLGLEFYIRLPESMPNSRLAVVESPGFLKLLIGFPFSLTIDSLNPRSNIHRALMVNPGSQIVHDKQSVYSRDLEVPSGGGVGTARAIARAYSIFATGGEELELNHETLDALKAPAVPPQHGFYDECMRAEAKFSLGFMKPSQAWPFPDPDAFGHPGAGGSLGFMKPSQAWPFPHPDAYGHPGAGGSLGYADPQREIGYAYVTNRMGVKLDGDPRDVALRDALYSATPAAR